MASKGLVYYPDRDDPKFYEKIYQKKEFYKNRIRSDTFEGKTMEELCSPREHFKLQPYQLFARNFMSPETPYTRYFLWLGTGVGKTCTAVTITEGFKPQMQSLYNNGQEAFIYILAKNEPQELFKKELIGDCGTLANNLSLEDENPYVTRKQKQELHELSLLRDKAGIEKYKKAKREYIKNKLEKPTHGGFYKFKSYSKFAIDVQNGKIKNIDNCVLVVDEAHNLLNENDWQQAVEKMVRNSKNVRVILLSATPMINKPSQIVDFLNIILEDPIKKSDIFLNDIDLKPGGLEKLQQKARGIISYIRGNNPYTFPKRIEIGETPKETFFDPKIKRKLKFAYTKLIRCPMSPLHYKTYKHFWQGAMRQELKQLMDMVLPDPSNPSLGLFTKEDLLKDRLPKAKENWLKKHKIELIPDIDAKGGQIQVSGDILLANNLKQYSFKYYKVLQNINSEVGLDNGLIFINGKFVHGIGIKLFGQILARNGYEEFDLNKPNPTIPMNPNTKCHFCGKAYSKHPKNGSTERTKGPSVTQQHYHIYRPSRYALLHADSSIEERNKIIEYYNQAENKDGSILKILLTANIGKESIDLKRIMYIHILNYQENFPKIDQIIGRGVRFCSHKDMPEQKRKVKVYKYVSSLPGLNGLSAEEQEYLEDENLFIVMKKIERALKKSSVDCALNKPINIFKKEIKENKGCREPGASGTGHTCSPLCDFTSCNYQCIYEPKGPGGKDASTYSLLYQNEETASAINYIRYLFTQEVVWSFKDILEAIHSNPELELMDEKYIYLALDRILTEAVPIKNPLGIKGTMVYKGKYYLFQPNGMPTTDLTINERYAAPKNYNTQNIIDVGQYVKNIMSKATKQIGKDDVLAIIEKENSRKKIASILGKLEIDQQKHILEDALKQQLLDYHKGRGTTSTTTKVLLNYKDFLISQEQLDDTSDYTSTTDESMMNWLTTDVGKKLFVGHVLLSNARCFNGKDWADCGRDIKILTPDEKENGFIIGFVDKDTRGKMVFKLRHVHPGEIITDRRKLRKGFQCAQTNDKEGLLKIADKLNLDRTDLKKKKIQDICNVIEGDLRRRQKESREKRQNIRWFYEYVDLLRTQKKA